MCDGVHPETVRLAELLLTMSAEAAGKLLAGMDYFVRERVLRVIEHDQRRPGEAAEFRRLVAVQKSPPPRAA